jgi:hypothetical protein
VSRFENVDFEDDPPPPRAFGERLLGAITLDATVYEEVEHYPDALAQAAAVVAIAALSRGLGEIPEGAFVSGVFAAFAGWIVGTAIIWVIGVGILDCTSDFRELLRTLGFASAPYWLWGIAALLGPLALPALLAVWVAGLVAWVVATRQALDVSTTLTVGICAVALLPTLFGSLLLNLAWDLTFRL